MMRGRFAIVCFTFFLVMITKEIVLADEVQFCIKKVENWVEIKGIEEKTLDIFGAFKDTRKSTASVSGPEKKEEDLISPDLSKLKQIFDNAFGNLANIVTVLAFGVALRERNARIKSEKQREKEKEENQYVYDLISKGLDQKELERNIGKLKEERDSLENIQQELNASIREEIPKLAKNSFGKYCAELYKEQLVENFKKYESFKEFLNDEESTRIPDSIIQQISEIQIKNNKNSIPFETIRELSLGIAMFFLLNGFGNKILLRWISYYFLLKPLIIILGFFSEEVKLHQEEIHDMLSSCIALMMMFLSNTFVLFAKYIDTLLLTLNKNGHVIEILLTVIFLGIQVSEIYWYIEAFNNYFELVNKEYTKRNSLFRIIIGVVLMITAFYFLFASGLSIFDLISLNDQNPIFQYPIILYKGFSLASIAIYVSMGINISLTLVLGDSLLLFSKRKNKTR